MRLGTFEPLSSRKRPAALTKVGSDFLPRVTTLDGETKRRIRNERFLISVTLFMLMVDELLPTLSIDLVVQAEIKGIDCSFVL